MKTKSTFFRHFPVFTSLLLFVAYSPEAACQAGINGGKPIITFNPTDHSPTKTQSLPSFPGGEDKLKKFVLRSIEETKNPIKLGRKTWLIASLDQEGKVKPATYR